MTKPDACSGGREVTTGPSEHEEIQSVAQPVEPPPEPTRTPSSRRERIRGTQTGAAKPVSHDPGAELEMRVARLEFAEGALTRLRVPVKAEDADAGRNVLTDIDVLAVDVDTRLRFSRSCLECKSGKGQSGEPDRLLWLAGFRQLLRLQRAVLVRTTVSRRGRALARRLDLQTLDDSTLRTREAAHSWLPKEFAHIGGPACYASETRTDTQLKGLNHIDSSLVTFLRYDALLANPHAIVSAVDALGNAVARQAILPEPTGTVLAGHALLGILLAALQDAGQLDMLPTEILQQRLERALTVGHPDDDYMLRVLDRADALVGHALDRVHDAYMGSGKVRQEVDVPSLRAIVVTPPAYITSYIDLVERLRVNPVVSRQLLQTAELVCFDALVGDRAWQAAAFDHLFTAEHRGLLLAVLRTLKAVAGDAVANPLRRIAELPFNRASPSLPDRHEPPVLDESGDLPYSDSTARDEPGSIRPTPDDDPPMLPFDQTR